MLALLAAAGCRAPLPARPPGAAAVVRGPLGLRIEHPFALGQPALRARTLATTPPGTLDVALATSYTSLFGNDDAGADSALLDGELLHGNVRLRTGLDDASDVELEVGALYGTSGFLDEFLDDWHGWFGLPDGDRDERPEDDYAMRFGRNGVDAWELEGDTVGLLDATLVYTRTLRAEDAGGPAVALRLALQVPTGSESRGFGNGRVDWGAGLALERSLGRWTWSGGLEYVASRPPESFAAADLDAPDRGVARFGAEYRLNGSTSLLTSVIASTPLVPDLETSVLSEPLAQLGLGVVFDAGRRSRWTLGFAEDLAPNSGVDVTFFVGWQLVR